jgi:hypothetical protein
VLRRFVQLTLLAAASVAISGTTAFAQCSDSVVSGAFQIVAQRQPTAQECNRGRFAGGDARYFSNTASLIPLVKASFVCQDPWIAQAYYVLGKPLNGHDPTVLENGRAGSTQNQCNVTNYGSWPDFPTLVRNVQNHLSPVVTQPKPVAGPSATITQAAITMNQPATVRWTFSGSPSNCGSGAFLRINGNMNWGTAINPASGMATVDARYTNFAWPAGTRLNLTIFDVCLGRDISPAYTVTLAGPPILPPPPPPTQQNAQMNVPAFHLISRMGSRCLGVPNGNRAQGTQLIQWDCLAQDDQMFKFLDNGQIAAFGGNGGLCLDDKGGMYKAGDPIVIWPCASSTSRWVFSNGRITPNTNPNMCIDLFGGWGGRYLMPNQTAQLWNCNGGDNQSWVAAVLMPKGNSVNPIPPATQTTITDHGVHGNILGHNGSAVITISAGNIVAAGAGNIVAAGAGNIVAAGAGNIVAAGAGNIVAAGAGNLISPGNMAGLITPNGSNLVGPGGSSLVLVPIGAGVVVSTRPY